MERTRKASRDYLRVRTSCGLVNKSEIDGRTENVTAKGDRLCGTAAEADGWVKQQQTNRQYK